MFVVKKWGQCSTFTPPNAVSLLCLCFFNLTFNYSKNRRIVTKYLYKQCTKDEKIIIRIVVVSFYAPYFLYMYILAILHTNINSVLLSMTVELTIYLVNLDTLYMYYIFLILSPFFLYSKLIILFPN